MKSARLLFPTALCSLLCFGAPTAQAQQGDAQLGRDMQFARELATRYAYVDYANEVLAELKGKDLGTDSKEALALLSCDVFAAGAGGAPTIVERTTLMEQALASYKKFIKDHPRSIQLSQAERAYVGLVNNYGRLLQARIDSAIGDERAAMLKKLVAELEEGLELTSDLMVGTENPTSPEEKNERYRLMLDRAQMYLTVGNAAEDGSYELSRAEETLTRLTEEAGELSGFGLSAFLMLAKVYNVQGLYDDAAAFYQYVVENVLPPEEARENAGWDSLSRESKVQRWRLGELGTKGLVDSFRALGDTESACMWSLHFFNYYKSEGFPLADPGNASLLSVASALLESDGFVGGKLNGGELMWFASASEMADAGFRGRNARSGLDMALSIAQDGNNAYKGKRSRLQVDAQKVISNIIERPGVTVSPEILLQAAEGDYNNKEYPKAIHSLKSILAELATRDEATQRQYMPHALYYLGQSYARLGRHLEASMAYREGVTTWKGDANWDEKLARQFNRSIGRVTKASGDDPRFTQMMLEAESILLSVASNTGNISFGQAERKYGKKDYDGARALYLQVEKGEPVYEKALMKAALCLYNKKDFVNARAEFKRYLEQYITDPRNKPVDREAKTARAQSVSLATYYLGSMAFAAGNYTEALAYLGDYHKKFESQESYCEIALSKVVEAQIALDELESAKQAFEDQRERFPASAQSGASAARIYSALNNILAKAKKAGDEGRVRELKFQMATYKGFANDMASTPSFNNLRIEAGLWEDLGEWERMERALRLAVKGFENDPDPKKDIKKRVLPDLGLALLKQKRLPEAFQVLDPLIDKDPDTKVKMGPTLPHRWAQSVAGWVEGDKDNLVEVPGAGSATDMETATRLLVKLTAVLPKYEGPWYQLKFDTAYTFYVWSKLDSSKQASTKNLIDNLKQRVGDERLKDITEKTGDDVLRSRFLWLASKVR